MSGSEAIEFLGMLICMDGDADMSVESTFVGLAEAILVLVGEGSL